LHPRARDPHPDLPDQELPQGGAVVATATADIRRPVVLEETVATKIARLARRAPVHLVLVVIGLIWLVPTFGLFLTSIISPTSTASSAWWKVFSQPSALTFRSEEHTSELQSQSNLVCRLLLARKK